MDNVPTSCIIETGFLLASQSLRAFHTPKKLGPCTMQTERNVLRVARRVFVSRAESSRPFDSKLVQGSCTSGVLRQVCSSPANHSKFQNKTRVTTRCRSFGEQQSTEQNLRSTFTTYQGQSTATIIIRGNNGQCARQGRMGGRGCNL